MKGDPKEYGQTASALYAKTCCFCTGHRWSLIHSSFNRQGTRSASQRYKAIDAAAYDDWVRASKQWDYFLRLLVSGAQKQHVSSSCRGPKNNRLAGRVAYVWVRLPAATF